MADEVKDAEINPLSDLLTPQALYMMRLQQMQQQMAQAGQLDGRNYAARMAGMGLGQALNTMGGQGRGPLDQLAQQNMQGLADNPMTGGGAASVDPSNPGAALEAQASVWDQRASHFAGTGQVQAAQAMTDKADQLRKQAEDLRKTVADEYQAYGKGLASRSDVEKTPVVGKAPTVTGWGYMRPTPGGGSEPVVGQDGKPIAAPPPNLQSAELANKKMQPFNDQFAKDLGASSAGLDQATSNLNIVHDMQDRLAQGLIAGTGSQARQDWDTALQTLGFKSPDPKLSNTQAFAAEGLQMALQMRASGMRVTQQEISWFRQAAAGDMNIPPEGLRAMLGLMQQHEEQKFTSYNRKADTAATMAKNDPAYAGLPTLYPRREAPTFAPAAPQSTSQAPAAKAPAQGAAQEGALSTSKSGKPIVFKDGHWQYVTASK